MNAGADPARSMPRVTIGICTYHRNDELSRLLHKIDALTPKTNGLMTLRAVVVDDSATAQAQSLIEGISGALSYSVEYVHAGSSNISVARNLVLEHGQVDADYLVLIDDDCLPEGDWLSELLRIQQETHADIVTGHRQFFVGSTAPAWLRDEPFCDENSIFEDGSEPAVGLTANILISVPWLIRSATRFRVDLGRTGGEDMAFFEDAKRTDARVRHAAKSVVREEFAGQRCSLKYQLHRQFWLGNNSAVHSLSTQQYTRLRLGLRGARHFVLAHAALFGRLRRGPAAQWHWYVASAARAGGLVLGAAGVKVRHRS